MKPRRPSQLDSIKPPSQRFSRWPAVFWQKPANGPIRPNGRKIASQIIRLCDYMSANKNRWRLGQRSRPSRQRLI